MMATFTTVSIFLAVGSAPLEEEAGALAVEVGATPIASVTPS